MSVGRSDVAIPKTALTRRRNSHSSGKEVVLQELAPLRDTPSTKREELFRKKLELCSFIFDFEDASSDKRGKETKRSTLLELVDYVNAQSGQKIFTEALMPDIMSMVKANICRALPPNRWRTVHRSRNTGSRRAVSGTYSIAITISTLARISWVPAAIGTDLASISMAIARFIIRGCGA